MKMLHSGATAYCEDDQLVLFVFKWSLTRQNSGDYSHQLSLHSLQMTGERGAAESTQGRTRALPAQRNREQLIILMVEWA